MNKCVGDTDKRENQKLPFIEVQSPTRGHKTISSGNSQSAVEIRCSFSQSVSQSVCFPAQYVRPSCLCLLVWNSLVSGLEFLSQVWSIRVTGVVGFPLPVGLWEGLVMWSLLDELYVSHQQVYLIWHGTQN